MTQEKQVINCHPKPSKHAGLERLMREFGCTNNDIADYPINDRKARWRIGKLISAAVGNFRPSVRCARMSVVDAVDGSSTGT